MYEKMVAQQTEFDILLDLPREDIVKLGNSAIAESIMRIREGKLHIEGGYDGLFGVIHIYEPAERKLVLKKAEQVSLF
jgi:DNA helicase-2/ATP-dependent DNA helicase PcrA